MGPKGAECRFIYSVVGSSSAFQGGPIDARVLVLNFAAKADVTRASDPAAQPSGNRKRTIFDNQSSAAKF
jgi:hypothetical protein